MLPGKFESLPEILKAHVGELGYGAIKRSPGCSIIHFISKHPLLMSKHDLKGKGVLIGGGAKNLGGLLSRVLAAEGAKICVHYNSAATKADADKTVADIRAAGGTAFAIQGDFTKVADVVAAFAARKRSSAVSTSPSTPWARF